MRYLNLKTVYGIETVDELDPKKFKTYRGFRQELKRLFNEYRNAGMAVYISQNPCKEWND